MDYVELFIEFLENYKENGKPKYIEKIKKMKKRKNKKITLTVELADVYRYNTNLGIKLINDVLSGKEELIPQILERLSSLLTVLNPSIDEIGLLIPNNIRLITGPLSEVSGISFDATGYIVFIDGKTIGILEPPEDIRGETLDLLIATLDINIPLSVGDKIYVAGRSKKKRFIINNVETIIKNEDPIESRVNVKNLLSLYSLPQDYPIRLIKFLQNFKDKYGRYKYRETIDQMIEKGEDLEVNLSAYDLLSYDKVLGEILLENPDFILPIYTEVIDFYVHIRFALKKGLLIGTKLKNEKVILSKDFIKLINESINLDMEEITYLLGGKLDRGKIIVKFTKFVDFIYKYGKGLLTTSQ